MFVLGLDNALRVFGLHKDVHMNAELSQGAIPNLSFIFSKLFDL